MGQFGNQPDFITHDIKSITPVTLANLTAADCLNGSIIYVGSSNSGGLQVIPAGVVGPSVISGFSSPGYAGSGGTGYDDVIEDESAIGGSGTNLTVNATAVNGVVQSVVVSVDDGGNYQNGDLITIDGGDVNAVFRIVAAPGLPTVAQAIEFDNVPEGQWFPVIVDYVLADTTTVGNLIAGK